MKDLFSKKKASTVEICLLSAGIRNKYLIQVDGRPNYAPEFINWIDNGNGATQYGDRSNFTKYAVAGDAINFFSNAKKPPKDDFDYESEYAL